MSGWRPIETPCTRVCQIDPKSGWCLGCARSLMEIGGWTSLTDADRARIMSELEARKEKMRELGSPPLPPRR